MAVAKPFSGMAAIPSASLKASLVSPYMERPLPAAPTRRCDLTSSSGIRLLMLAMAVTSGHPAWLPASRWHCGRVAACTPSQTFPAARKGPVANRSRMAVRKLVASAMGHGHSFGQPFRDGAGHVQSLRVRLHFHRRPRARKRGHGDRGGGLQRRDAPDRPEDLVRINRRRAPALQSPRDMSAMRASRGTGKTGRAIWRSGAGIRACT